MEKNKSERRLVEALGFEKRDGNEDAAPKAQHTERSGKGLRSQLMDNKE